MKLNLQNYPKRQPEFFEALGLRVSYPCMVLSEGTFYIAALWEDKDSTLVWRSAETGNIISNVDMWAELK